jgi:DNA-binding CsgD family transcriptional regulator
MSNAFFTALNLGVLGRLELAVGNAEAAAGYLRELPERLLASGLKDPAQPIWPDAIETLIALGELEDARRWLEQHEWNAHRFGSPLAVAGAARCRGLLAAAEGDFDTASASFDRALAELAGMELPIEHGRTLLSLGSMLRRAQQKRAAREALGEALAIFERLGAPLWAERTRVELRRISGRAPHPEELTETEEQVARLAAQGRSNKEIAAELFMGVSTVEMHLSRVYRKLGVRRAELGGRLMLRGEPAET